MLLNDSSSAKIGGSNVNSIISENSFYVFDGHAMGLSKSITGSGFVEKNGAGILSFSGNNTYLGSTKIKSGILYIDSVSALPGFNVNGRYSVENEAALVVGNSVTDTQFTGILGTANYAAGAFVGFDTTSGNRSYGNSIANSTSGKRGLVKLGKNTLTLTSATTYTHDTRVIDGVLATSLGNCISNFSSLIVEKNGTFRLLGGSDDIASIAGGGVIDIGTNYLSTVSNDPLLNPIFSGSITGSSANIYYFIKNGTYTQKFAGNTNISGAVVNIRNGRADFDGIFTVNRSGNQNRNFQFANSSIDDVATGNINGAVFSANGFMMGDNAKGTTVLNIGSGGLFKTNGELWWAGKSSTLNISGRVEAGTLYMGGGTPPSQSILNVYNNGFISGGSIDLGRAGPDGAIIINLGSGPIGGKMFFANSTIFGTSFGHKINFNGGSLGSTANGYTFNDSRLFFNIQSGGAVFEVLQNVTNTIGELSPLTGIGGLVKSGLGVLALAGNNTYLGDTLINQGAIRLGNNGTSGSISPIGSIYNNGTLIINRGGSMTISNKILGSGNINNQGVGTIILSGDNSYSGTTTISAGVLQISNSNSLGSGGDLVFAGGTLRYGAGTDVDLSSRIKNSSSAVTIDTNGNNIIFSNNIYSSNSGIYKLGSGELEITSSGSYSSTTRVEGGTLNINGGLLTSGLIQVGYGTMLGVLKIRNALTQVIGNGPRSFQSASAAPGVNTGPNSIAEIYILSGANILLTGANPGMMLGENNGGKTTYIQSGGSLNNLGQLWFAGKENYFVQNGGSYSCTTTWLGAGGAAGHPANISVFTLSDSASFTNTSSLQFSAGGVNFSGITFNLDGGTYINRGGYGYNGGSSAGPTIWNFNGGKLLQFNDNVSFPSQVNTIVKSGGMNIAVNGNNLTLNKPLSGTVDSGGVIKSGNGTLIMGNFAHSYSGATTIAAGTITVARTLNSVTASATFTTGALSVNFGGGTIASGWQYKFFPGSTTLINPFPITLSNYLGGARTASYNFLTSTLTLN